MMAFIKKLLLVIFQISMPLFILLGTIIVLVQIYCVFSGNGALCVSIHKSLYIWASNATGVCLFVSFIHSYLKKVV